jgi:hypothetical protein
MPPVCSQRDYMTALVFQIAADVPGVIAIDPAEPFTAAARLAGVVVLPGNLEPAPAPVHDMTHAEGQGLCVGRPSPLHLAGRDRPGKPATAPLERPHRQACWHWWP